MAANAINNFFGAHSQGLGGLGAFGGLGYASSTKSPQLERYHDEHHGWSKGPPPKGKKGNVALSALTLLAFLFFLHILQNCIQEHMQEMKGHRHRPNGINATIALPNVIVIDSSSNSNNNGRDNLKGDGGELPLSEEELDQWPLKDLVMQKQAQNRVYQPRAKKNHQKQKQAGKKQQQHRNIPKPLKNTIQGIAYPVDTDNLENLNIPMHRIDNIP